MTAVPLGRGALVVKRERGSTTFSLEEQKVGSNCQVEMNNFFFNSRPF